MIQQTSGVKHYKSAHDRQLKPAIARFLENELLALGPMLADRAADALIQIFERNAPKADRIKHGQMLWNALDKNTRASSKNKGYVPVILSVVTDHDISLSEKETPIKEIRKIVVARLINEAFEQGGILSTRDLSLILCVGDAMLSQARMQYEKENNVVLPHQGVLHDMGTTITHKGIIIYKKIVEKKDTNVIALETNHSQKSVDIYIRNFNRERTLLDEGKSIEYIHTATCISNATLIQYQNIYNQYVKEQ